MPTCKELFIKYKNLCNIHLETGAHVGHGVQAALDAGFNTVYSIELSEYFYNFCRNRFNNNQKVTLVLGDSSIKLKEVLDNINEPCMFFLDGHFSGGNTALGNKHSPLIEELEIIKNHSIKDHVIICDDIRLWEDEYNFSIKKVKAKLHEINPNYKFILEDSYRDGKVLFKNDILVATL